MFSSHLFRLFRRKPSATTSWSEAIHTPPRFQKILETERLRSDRSGIRFCLVVYALTEQPIDQRAAFVSHLESRIRGTDHIGMLNENEIGIILWDTQEAGAKCYIQSVNCQKLTSRIPSPKIYIYPDIHRPHLETDALQSETHPTECSLPVNALSTLYVRQLPRWKRLVDVCGATAGLLTLSPLLLLTAFLVKLTSRGPVLFKQQRDGLGGERFTIYKFRTMRQDAERLKDELRNQSEQDGPAFKLTNDPRITPIGRYLRKTCIDELPQLWNVLKGDMTLVGPRPLDSREAEKIVGWGRRRLDITPGLTCIWQVHGKSKVTFDEWMRMDIRYIGRRHLKGDIKLIWETIVAVVCHRASV